MVALCGALIAVSALLAAEVRRTATVPLWSVVVVFVVSLMLSQWVRRKRRRVVRNPPDYLESLFLTSGAFTLTLRMLCQGLLCLGMVGSGKTTGVIAFFLGRLLRLGCGGLVVCPKADDAPRWLKLAARSGRSSDVFVIDASAKHRLNFFRSVLRCSGDPATKAMIGAAAWDLFSQVASRSNAQGGGEDGKFWQESYTRCVRSILLLLLLADVEPTPTAILEVMQAIPKARQVAKPGWANSEWWQNSPLLGLLQKAYRNAVANDWLSDFRAVKDYLTVEQPNLSSKTRSVIEAMVSGVADTLTKGLAAKLLATDSTFDLGEAMAANKLVVVDLPVGEWLEVAKFVGAAVVFLAQTEALKREVKPDTKPWPIVVDEAQEYLTEHWFKYVSLSRSSRCPMVLASQGYESFAALFSGSEGQRKVETLMGNLGTTIVACPTYETADWLSRRLGQEKRVMFSGSQQQDAYQSPLDLWGGAGSATASFSEQYHARRRADEIQQLLPPGGPPHWTVRTIVVRGAWHTLIDFNQEVM